jgi:hypothetical protein
MGSPSDPPGAKTVPSLGDRKNELVLELIGKDGVTPYEGRSASSRRRAIAGWAVPSCPRA